MFEVKDKPEMVERALLVRLAFNKRDEDEDISLLEELEELVRTLGIGVAELHLAFSRSMHRKFLCGTGKADEIVAFAKRDLTSSLANTLNPHINIRPATRFFDFFGIVNIVMEAGCV